MSPDPTWPYSVLGLTAPPETQADIRRAYAKRLKTIDQSTDIAGFTALRHAYEAALSIAAFHHAPASTETAPEADPLAELQADPSPEPAPLSVDTYQPAPPSAQPDPDLHRLTTLLTSYGDGRPLAERITEILAHPLSHNPDHAPTLRRAIARALTNTSQPGSDDRNLPISITQTLLRDLNTRYGWLSDYTAFAADFPGDTELLDLMALRAFPKFGKPRTEPQPVERGLLPLIRWVLGSYSVQMVSFAFLLQVSKILDRPTAPRPYTPEQVFLVLLQAATLGLGVILLYRYLRVTRTPRHSLIILGWLGLGSLLLLLPVDPNVGLIDLIPVQAWLACSALWLADFWFPKVRPFLTRVIASAFT